MTQRKLASSGAMTIAAAGPSKLRASSAFLEKLNEHPEDIVAFVEVAKDDYVPKGVELRQSISPTLFTAKILARELEGLLADDQVVLVQPTGKLGTLPAS